MIDRQVDTSSLELIVFRCFEAKFDVVVVRIYPQKIKLGVQNEERSFLTEETSPQSKSPSIQTQSQ